MLVLVQCGIVGPFPKPHAKVSPIVGCPQLHIQCILRGFPLLEAIRSLTTRHGLVAKGFSCGEFLDQLKACIILGKYSAV